MPMMAFSLYRNWLAGACAAFQPPPLADYMRILPELVLSIFGMLVMVVDPLLDEETSQNDAGHRSR